MQLMTKTDHIVATKTQLPSFYRRWALFFRYFPRETISFRFWRGVVTGRNPILWHGVAHYAERHPHCRFGNHTEDCREKNAGSLKNEQYRRPGLWRDDS